MKTQRADGVHTPALPTPRPPIPVSIHTSALPTPGPPIPASVHTPALPMPGPPIPASVHMPPLPTPGPPIPASIHTPALPTPGPQIPASRPGDNKPWYLSTSRIRTHAQAAVAATAAELIDSTVTLSARNPINRRRLTPPLQPPFKPSSALSRPGGWSGWSGSPLRCPKVCLGTARLSPAPPPLLPPRHLPHKMQADQGLNTVDTVLSWMLKPTC